MKFKEWMSTIGINAFRHANCCKIAYEAGQQSRQAEIDEQQKRIDELESHQEKQSECIKNLVSQRNSASSRVESSLILIEKFFDDQVQTPTPRQYANFIQEIYEALKGGDE